MSVAVRTRFSVLLFAAVSIASISAHAHGGISDEAVWFFLAALLAIPVFLLGVILLIVHLVQHTKQSNRARRAATKGHTSEAASASTERKSNAGALAAWFIGGSVTLLVTVVLAGVVSRQHVLSFWSALAVFVTLAALIVWVVRVASRQSRALRGEPLPSASAPHAATLPLEPEPVIEPRAKPSNAMLWLSIVLLVIAGFAVLSPFYLMHRKDVARKQAESARIAKAAEESQQDLDRAAESARNKARIDQMAREMMGEPPLPAPPPPPMTAEQKALAQRAADEQRIHCSFQGVFSVEKRGVPYQFTMRADGTFESVNKTDKSVRAGKWSYSTEPNRAGDSHMLIFKYSVGLPATEEERLTQTGSKRVSTQNSAGRYDYELLEALDHPECNDPIRKRDYPKRSP